MYYFVLSMCMRSITFAGMAPIVRMSMAQYKLFPIPLLLSRHTSIYRSTSSSSSIQVKRVTTTKFSRVECSLVERYGAWNLHG